MAAIENEKIYGLKIRESADDGSDFSNPDADYRILYVGEDGNIHLRDSAGTITTPNTSSGSLDFSGMTIERSVQPVSDYVAGYDASAADERGFPVYALHGGRQGFTIFDECFFGATTGIYAGQVTQNVSGSGAASAAGTAASNHPGTISLSTGTTTSGRCALSAGNDGTAIIPAGSGKLRVGIVAKIPTLSDGTNTFTVRLGGFGTNAGDQNAIYFRYTHGTNSGKWQGVSRNGGSESTVDTGITADTSYHTFEYEVNAAGTSIQFYIDGVATGSPITTNINTGTALYVVPASIIKSAGTTARTVEIDAYWYSQEFTTAR